MENYWVVFAFKYSWIRISSNKREKNSIFKKLKHHTTRKKLITKVDDWAFQLKDPIYKITDLLYRPLLVWNISWKSEKKVLPTYRCISLGNICGIMLLFVHITVTSHYTEVSVVVFSCEFSKGKFWEQCCVQHFQTECGEFLLQYP